MILKARADEAKTTIQALAFAQERYHQERGKYYVNGTTAIVNEQMIHENLKVDLSKSNNFIYSIEEGTTTNYSYIIKATLRDDDWDTCGSTTSDSFLCKQNDSQDRESWVNAYSDTISEDNHYLEFTYPELIDNDYSEEGISYENLYE